MLTVNIYRGLLRFTPLVEGAVQWDTAFKGQASKATLTIIDDGNIALSEGNTVTIETSTHRVFKGYIFSIKRTELHKLSITAYDQMRYLKNKDTRKYSDLTASGLIRDIAADFILETGDIEETGYLLPSRIEDDKSLMEMIQNALDETQFQNGKMYAFYDDYGALTLKELSKNGAANVIELDDIGGFDYTRSIDKDTYNVVKLVYDNEKSQKRDVFKVQDSHTIDRWGILQYFEKIDAPDGAPQKAEGLLKLKNKPVKRLSLSNVIGDFDIRAGRLVRVVLREKPFHIDHHMIVTKATHQVDGDAHTMSLELIGGDYSA